MALRQLFVSPSTKKASGLIFSITVSIFTKVSAIECIGDSVLHLRKTSGSLSPKSLKKIWFNS